MPYWNVSKIQWSKGLFIYLAWTTVDPKHRLARVICTQGSTPVWVWGIILNHNNVSLKETTDCLIWRKIHHPTFWSFQGELCLAKYAACEIVMGVIGGVAAVLSVVLIVAYRSYRYEQELDSLLWKIDPIDLKVIQARADIRGEINYSKKQLSLSRNI